MEMPLKKLGDVCHFVRGPFGGSLKKSCFKSNGNAVYEQQHAIYNQFNKIRYFVDDEKFEEMKRFELKSGDLIMSCSGTMGKVAIVPDGIKKGIINQALLKLTPSKDLDVKYLRYWMSSNDFQESLAKYTVGAAIKNVASVKILKQIEAPLPLLEEQKQIVALLDEAFIAIDQAKANIEKNIVNAKELFQSKLNAIFSQKGEGWEEKSLGEIGKGQTGTTPPTKDKTNYGDYIPFVKPPHFHQDGTINSKESKLSEKGLEKGRLFPANSILMVCIGATIGKTGFSEIPVSANQQINALTPSKNFVPKLLYYALISPFVQNQIISLGISAQATLPIINKSKWLKLKVNLPLNKTEQSLIVKKLENLKENCFLVESKYRQKLNDLEDLKKSILQKAFSGELTQKEVVV
jgi:type I restriction enzyme S subunit